MARKVAQAVVSYLDANGSWQTALRGAEIEVHKDDLARLEAAGAFDAPPPAAAEVVGEDAEEPARSGRGSGVEAWTAYAEALGIDVPEGASRDDVITLVDDQK